MRGGDRLLQQIRDPDHQCPLGSNWRLLQQFHFADRTPFTKVNRTVTVSLFTELADLVRRDQVPPRRHSPSPRQVEYSRPLHSSLAPVSPSALPPSFQLLSVRIVGGITEELAECACLAPPKRHQHAQQNSRMRMTDFEYQGSFPRLSGADRGGFWLRTYFIPSHKPDWGGMTFHLLSTQIKLYSSRKPDTRVKQREREKEQLRKAQNLGFQQSI
ncbi:hypothetical protein C0Q70_14318 [Pomacea canaliculata]|uniref:Uncharacterized protein n=1 Tax=Pomacea canaliculata TaxID=400727 RepID=A0A2T7NZP5_POMCA|nr:hypothetical protein C0Q70_14318 [Pomacea canaliculata]